MPWYIVRLDEDTTRRVEAGSEAEAFNIIRDEHEAQFGDGSFDQYEVTVEDEPDDEDDDPED